MQKYAKNNEILDFLTPAERRRKEKYQKIIVRYNEIKTGYDISESRIFKQLAAEFDMTANGIRLVIRKISNNDTNRTESR